MAYVVTLTAEALLVLRPDLRATQRYTKAFTKGRATMNGSRMVLMVRDEGGEPSSRSLAWMGVAVQRGIVGGSDESLTTDHLRECLEDVPLDGDKGLLRLISAEARTEFDQVCALGQVGALSRPTWSEIEAQLRAKHPDLVPTLNWLTAIANPVVLSNDTAEDRRWQEHRDAVGLAARIFDSPPTTFSAWERPQRDDAPYLAGLIPEPVENSFIDHDVRSAGGMQSGYSPWMGGPSRFDIHVFQDSLGRTLEIANVNATPVEGRLGTDMIYYYAPTSSFVLVQYKRLDSDTRMISVDKRLKDQLTRLENVRSISKPASSPDDWRLGSDPCYLKLAYWPKNGGSTAGATGLTPGMYLPVSYVRLLLADNCTLSRRNRKNGEPGRLLGYPQVARYLINTQFIAMVRNGLIGTVGVTVEQLRDVVDQRVRAGHDAVVAIEDSRESAADRQKRAHGRGSPKRGIKHVVAANGDSSPGKPGEQIRLFDFSE
ncbi:hypothetical protein [Nocardia gipuzkoensis]|uniref:hypothetical protein n=1 Tax=Nocardia gipuzkoensis TaxID=2749991 RepID=UPI00237ED2D9|nr:hypothetical protein [Nocardia gipuzkoensis]MDE1675156.1 hypothetical protein [Nocardia gipuzkoensis]